MAEKISYYTDEHVGKAVVRGLRYRGVDVRTTPEANMLGAADEEHLEFAVLHDLVIFTQDIDFLRLASINPEIGLMYQAQRHAAHRVVSSVTRTSVPLDTPRRA